LIKAIRGLLEQRELPGFISFWMRQRRGACQPKNSQKRPF
jgi:hypothetical protein